MSKDDKSKTTNNIKEIKEDTYNSEDFFEHTLENTKP